ncbi:ABC transporter permease subunit [Bradyrhizobium sp. HKCCYLS2038]|uniref:branched-chain amino acid ABC transporter ATP-binding protein/permease n=1 Tax=unclassified Bradyrhizobium TaxID=2631580 RepID=UPI003EBAE03A
MREWWSARGKNALAFALVAAAIVYPVMDANEGNIDVLSNAMALAMLALGLNIIVGFAGMLDLGFAAFFAIGAYGYGVFASHQVQPEWSAMWEPFRYLGLVEKFNDGSILRVHFTVSFWLMVPIAAIFAAISGIAFGAPTLRLSGDYLAIVTLGFGEIVPILVRNSPYFTNGAMGLNGVAPPRIFEYNFGIKSLPYYYLGLAMLIGLILLSIRLRDSRIGRAWMAIREDETVAQVMGVDRVRYRLLAFAIGAAFAGAAGTFYVAKLQTATPEMFGFPVSIMILAVVVLGGVGSVAGVVCGALLLTLLQSWFLKELTQTIHLVGRSVGLSLDALDLVQASELILGVILVVMMLYRRQGLVPEHVPALGLQKEWSSGLENSPGALLSRSLDPVDPDRPLLEIVGLDKSFGGLEALSSFQLTVMPGEIVALIGPNGSGKTTLFDVITGLVDPDRGEIRYLGREITGLASHHLAKRGISRTFQSIRLFDNLSLLTNVMIGAHSRTRSGVVPSILRTRRARQEEAAMVRAAASAMGFFDRRLTPRRDDLASSLSYANRRRLEIARALMSQPRLLLLDEPTAGMNPTETAELAALVQRIAAAGITILLIEHKLGVVFEIASRVIVLDQGRKVAEGGPREVQRDKETLSAYLGRAGTT